MKQQEQRPKPLTAEQIKALEQAKLDKKLTGQIVTKDDKDTKPKG